jgi:two-component system sensor histidine kinase BarA
MTIKSSFLAAIQYIPVPRWNICTLLFIFCAVFFSSVHAQVNTQILRSEEIIDLSDTFFVYPEQSQELSIDEILKRKQEFRWKGENSPNFGFSEHGLWLKAKFTHFTDNQIWVVDLNFSQLDKVDFYLVSDNQVIQKLQQGKLRHNQQYRIPVFKADIPSGQPIELFMRVESDSSSLIVPVSIRSESSHAQTMLLDSIIWGLFYGGLSILALYNLALFFGVRESSLLAYCGYICTVLVWQFVWGGHIHLMQPSEVVNWMVTHTSLIFIAIGVSSGIFSVTFLNTPTNAPKAHMAVLLMLYLQGLLGLAETFSIFPAMWLNGAIYVIGILAICSYLAAGVEAYLNKFHPARYFIFAWGMLATSAIAGILSLIGILPSNRFTAYCFQVGVFLEAGLFSLALMDKSRNQLEMEVEQATTDLRNNMELIEEQNVRLDIARKDAIKASNVKSQFLANMSHEIRTPLNAILGFSRELSNASLSPEKQEQVRIINGAADNLLTIVNDVLDFSKIEAGKLALNNQPFSPNQLFEEIVRLMAKSAHQKRLEFIYELSPIPEKLIGDVFRIKQILNNLLGNALKFTSSGHILFSASGRSLAHGFYELELRVEDTGIGISRKDRKKLFNAFSQVDDALNRSYQGTGLGLVITQELVKLMHGQLTLSSTVGQGSSFTIKLQMNQLSKRFHLSPQEEWRNRSILVFDPIPATRMASAKLFDHMGATVTSVESIQFLDELKSEGEQYDYLFACIPQSKIDARNDVLSHLLDFKANKRVLLYSGPEPFNHYPSLSQHFNTQLRMPLTPDKLDSLLKAPKHIDENPVQTRLKRLPAIKVLAVDDMEMNLKLLQTWLTDTPIKLTLCHAGEDAVSKCETEEFDLILMDVQMPNMDGLQATNLIRKTKLNLGTPIIAVTAHAFKEEQERLMASGMDDYLPKPIELNQLIEMIKRWCELDEKENIEIDSVDWDLALSRANGDSEAAKEMMASFIEQLPTTMASISILWKEQAYESLLTEIHRIHGATCYTGAIKFQNLCKTLEEALKRNDIDVVALELPNLLSEAKAVIASGNRD